MIQPLRSNYFRSQTTLRCMWATLKTELSILRDKDIRSAFGNASVFAAGLQEPQNSRQAAQNETKTDTCRGQDMAWYHEMTCDCFKKEMTYFPLQKCHTTVSNAETSKLATVSSYVKSSKDAQMSTSERWPPDELVSRLLCWNCKMAPECHAESTKRNTNLQRALLKNNRNTCDIKRSSLWSIWCTMCTNIEDTKGGSVTKDKK